ncbi:MAG: Ig-like domain-containing protein [Deltaproteobacteria bacterium]|nr:Ig-like domain-containing protein [Deltaproteobacteria bacterium]
MRSLLLSLTPLLLIACGEKPEPQDTSDPVDTSVPVDTSDTDDTGTEPPPPTLQGVVVHPFAALVRQGETTQLRARAVWSDATTTSLSTGLSWQLLAGSAGVLSGAGVLTGVEDGVVALAASYQGETTLSQARVLGAGTTVTGLSLTPSTTSAVIDGDVIFAALAALSDGTSGDLATSCSWSSSDPELAQVGAPGVVHALAVGEVQISADCGADGSASATFSVKGSVGELPPPDLSVASFTATPERGGVVHYEVVVENLGGPAAPFDLDLFQDLTDAPTAGVGDAHLTVPGMGPGQQVTVALDLAWAGERPVTLSGRVALDLDQELADADRSNNQGGPVSVTLEPDPVTNLTVFFDSAMSWGTESGVYITLTNNGPATASDLTLYFERDQPGVTLVSDLRAEDAEMSESIVSLAPGETYGWVFDYMGAPYSETWTSCGFVAISGSVDEDLSDNFDCYTWSD